MTLVRLKKSDLAFAQRENHVGMVKFNAIIRGNCIDRFRIQAKGVQGSKLFAGRRFGWERCERKTETKNKREKSNPRGQFFGQMAHPQAERHAGSVVTFSMGGQACGDGEKWWL